MRYTYEYKRECVKLYREGKWPETPEGISQKHFRDMVREWVRLEDGEGPETLRHKNSNKQWTAEERFELVSEVLAGKSVKETAINAGINSSILWQWLHKYKIMGYTGLVMKKGRPCKESSMKHTCTPEPLTESEREELIRLRAEIAYMKAENEVIKKEIALREEKRAAQLKARRQRSSKNSVKKDTN